MADPSADSTLVDVDEATEALEQFAIQDYRHFPQIYKTLREHIALAVRSRRIQAESRYWIYGLLDSDEIDEHDRRVCMYFSNYPGP